MNRPLKIYSALLILIFIGIILLDGNTQKPIDWTPTYDLSDKKPLGLFVLGNEIDSLLKKQKVEKIQVTPYEYLDPKFDDDTLVKQYRIKGTVLNISGISKIDDESVKEICYFVSHGNSAFISAKVLPNSLLDTLHLKMDSEYKMENNLFYWLANPPLGKEKYHLVEGMDNNYFSRMNAEKTTILGYQSGDSTRANFVKVKYYDGTFFLHTQPAAFTNFHMLKSNHHKYAQKVLSYIPKGNVYWFVKEPDGSSISNSPMRYINSQPALRWAWYIFLIGMAVLILFNAKRKQRIVPIITPLANTTIEFAKSIGNLYYQEGQHDNIIDKKIIYFLEKVRNEYLIETNKLDEDFIKKLHHKSGKSETDIRTAVFLINAHQKSPHNSIEEDLIQISNAIEKIIN